MFSIFIILSIIHQFPCRTMTIFKLFQIQGTSENKKNISDETEMHSNLRLILFCSANWIPFTISGSSGTMANTVTPIKYWKTRKGISAPENTPSQNNDHASGLAAYNARWRPCIRSTWEMEEWVRIGSMFSVQRSAQQAMSAVATINTARAFQRDQCTTGWLTDDRHPASTTKGQTFIG